MARSSVIRRFLLSKPKGKQMKTAEVNGASLAYDVAGEGPPVIFVHGFLANSTGPYYARLKQRLSAFCRVHCLDMRGHGGTLAADSTVTLDQCARDIIAFAKKFGLKGAALVGHSMGAYLSMAAALIDPDRFSALALLTPAGSRSEPNPEAVIADFMAARKDRSLMNMWFASMFVSRPEEAMLDICREAALRMPDAVAERWMREEWQSNRLTEKLPGLRLPALSVIGAQDIIVSPQLQYEDALRIKGSKIVTYADGGHMLPIEHPDRCAREVARFLGDVL